MPGGETGVSPALPRPGEGSEPVPGMQQLFHTAQLRERLQGLRDRLQPKAAVTPLQAQPFPPPSESLLDILRAKSCSGPGSCCAGIGQLPRGQALQLGNYSGRGEGDGLSHFADILQSSILEKCNFKTLKCLPGSAHPLLVQDKDKLEFVGYILK